MAGLWLLRAKKRSHQLPSELETKDLEKASEGSKPPSTPKSKSVWGGLLKSWSGLLSSSSKDQKAWEEVLISSDMGPKLANELISKLQKSEKAPAEFFKEELYELIKDAEAPQAAWESKKPWVVFIIGVNGAGKTTSIVKLARHLLQQSKSVGVVGADTFRKAAIEQLERGVLGVGADFFSIKSSNDESEGADPSAVIFDGLSKFKEKDTIIVDTSGRLQTKKNLMEELKKMKRVAQKVMPEAPHDVWLVIDSTLGQNSVSQGRAFHEALGVTGLVLTKLDGLSRGGTIFQLFQELKTPIRFLGVGERPEELLSFKSRTFVEDLFDQKASNP